MQRIYQISLTVIPSQPNAIIVTPSEGQSYNGGTEIILEEESIDADFDIVYREWEVIDKSTGTTVLTSSASTQQISLQPGEYLVQLTVRDSLQNTEVATRNIRVENTDPLLDANSLVVTPAELTTGLVTTIEVSVILSDPDGTTQDVRGTLIHGIQVWDFDLQDLDGDNVWEGSVEVNPEKPGRPILKITATDGSGDSATISQISRTIIVNDADQASTNLPLIIGGGAIIVVLMLVSLVMARMRKSKFEDELIESWDVFSKPSSDEKPIELEGGALDGASEVANEVWSQLEQEEGLN